ncbi:unnamed protein product [Amoebophrya sp. A120]|nr:unnamed protein product [Amoebophrya sp. A120]|eukprot:GSA120T00024359001.1
MLRSSQSHRPQSGRCSLVPVQYQERPGEPEAEGGAAAGGAVTTSTTSLTTTSSNKTMWWRSGSCSGPYRNWFLPPQRTTPAKFDEPSSPSRKGRASGCSGVGAMSPPTSEEEVDEEVILFGGSRIINVEEAATAEAADSSSSSRLSETSRVRIRRPGLIGALGAKLAIPAALFFDNAAFLQAKTQSRITMEFAGGRSSAQQRNKAKKYFRWKTAGSSRRARATSSSRKNRMMQPFSTSSSSESALAARKRKSKSLAAIARRDEENQSLRSARSDVPSSMVGASERKRSSANTEMDDDYKFKMNIQTEGAAGAVVTGKEEALAKATGKEEAQASGKEGAITSGKTEGKAAAGDGTFVKKVEHRQWQPHYTTVYHAKLPGGSYTEHSPLSYLDDNSLTTGTRCILHMLLLYCIVLTTTSALQWWLVTMGGTPKIEGLLAILQSCKHVIFVMPMLAILFLATRIRCQQLGKGLPTKYDLPLPWMKDFMAFSAIAITIQLALMFVTPILSGKLPEVDHEGNLILDPRKDPARSRNTAMKIMLILRLVCVLIIFLCALAVAKGNDDMADIPAVINLWRPMAPPAVSPAVGVVFYFSYFFFSVYFLQGIVRLLNWKSFDAVLQVATTSMQIVPVLCALILASRMRALQIDPVSGAPQHWCQKLFYVTFVAVIIQIVAILATALFIGGQHSEEKQDPNASTAAVQNKFHVRFPGMFAFLNAIRFFALSAVYASILGITFAISQMKNDADTAVTVHTPPMSQTLMNLLVLVYLHLASHLIQYGMTVYRQVMTQTQKQIPDKTEQMHKMITRWLDHAKSTILFIPMIAVFELQLSMRARQMTFNQTDDYPTNGDWKIPVSMCEWIVTATICALFFSVPFIVTRAGPSAGNMTGAKAYAVSFFRGVMTIVLYVGVGLCVLAMFDPGVSLKNVDTTGGVQRRVASSG